MHSGWQHLATDAFAVAVANSCSVVAAKSCSVVAAKSCSTSCCHTLHSNIINPPAPLFQMQVRRVQQQINNEPSEALGGSMTRSQALFGHPSLRPVQPPAEFIANLLQLNR